MTTDERLKRLASACRAVNPQAELVLTVTPAEVRLQLKGIAEQPVRGKTVDEAIGAGEGAIRSDLVTHAKTLDQELASVRQKHEAVHSLLGPEVAE